MPFRSVFSDENNNEMDCYLNTKGELYIGITQKDDDPLGNGYITLGKADVQELIKVLSEINNQME